MSRERPIIFSTEMVRAIQAGRKTQTRRVIKPQYATKSDGGRIPLDEFSKEMPLMHFAPCQPGDILWVRETFCPRYFDNDAPAYKSDYHKKRIGDVVPEPKWKPSIHMPRSAARLFLRLTDVKAERLCDISEDDAKAEGLIERSPGRFHFKENANLGTDAHTAKQAFMWLWNEINSKRGFIWASNPWVWVYTFERCEEVAP